MIKAKILLFLLISIIFFAACSLADDDTNKDFDIESARIGDTTGTVEEGTPDEIFANPKRAKTITF